MAHIGEFAKRVKLSGTPQERESFDYLQRQMASYGYETRLIEHDAYISLPGEARLKVDGGDIRCITHSMSASSPADGLTAEVVYGGDGSPADFARLDARGRIVLVDGIATEEVAAQARDHSAAGLIHVSPNELLYEMCVSPVWGSPSQLTRDQLPTAVICTIAAEARAILRERCKSGETVNATMWASVDTGWRKTPILVAELDAFYATDDERPFVLFSGHHDTWHFGVMDNGGANATMLEAARLLAARRDRWRRGLRICFWSGHSHGRYSGSAWYADEYWDELDRRCVAHVNVDSTGGEGADVLANSAVIDELKALAAEAVLAETGQVHAGRRHGRAADQSFWGVGLPSMFGSLSHQPPGPIRMPTALGWWWHTPQDTAEHIDPANLVRDTRIVLRVLDRLLTDEVLPLDYGATAASLQRELERIGTDLAGRFDITRLIAEAERFGELAGAVRRRAASATGAEARAINRALMRVSRLLVPLNYTQGNRFVHDSALPHAPWPSLDGLRALATAEADEDALFHAVHARQCRNLAAYALREAQAALATL
ncbi:M28 family peptidase [Shinella sp. BYT-45]|uniref:M28 family peptidase n=1 Tax=Shinella sp. BYT-45 TaxID=3377377 RepID=UPI00397EAD66